MKAEKDNKTGKWLIQYRYTDWHGIRRKSTKRGFATKKEAEIWLRDFLISQELSLDISFGEFLKIYYSDLVNRVRENTMNNKRYIIDLKILPYFANKKLNLITPADIRKWQNEIISQGYSQTYLRSINNQLTAIFNYAVKYYDLKQNPCSKAGTIGKKSADEMLFWTKDEFSKFIDAIMDKQTSYVAFMILFWTGIRVGELLALTPNDINFDDKTISINKSYQRIKSKDVITPPKTPKSNRIVSIPNFLAEDIKDYLNNIYSIKNNSRIFFISKGYLEREIKRGIKLSGVKKIRIHDLRHSHCALLFEMGFNALEVADRLGHERVETTLNVYAHIYPNKQRQISDKLEQIYKENFNE